MLSLLAIVLRYAKEFVVVVSLFWLILVEQSAVAGLVLAHYSQVLCWCFVVPLTMFRYVSATALFVLLI